MLIADAEQLSLGPADDIRVGTSQVFFVEGREISVFRREQNWFAIDNHCPHSGASLASGKCGESIVTCGWHHWQFDLRTGEAIGPPWLSSRDARPRSPRRRVVDHALQRAGSHPPTCRRRRLERFVEQRRSSGRLARRLTLFGSIRSDGMDRLLSVSLRRTA